MFMKSPDELADAILALSYGDLLGIGQGLASMSQSCPTPTSAADFAQLLWDWASVETQKDQPGAAPGTD
jgi:hypothetical protein